MIDTHAHLYLHEFDNDRAAMIERARQKLKAIILPNIDLETLEQVENLAREYPGFLWPTIGLHPCSVKENFRQELQKMEKRLVEHSKRYVAIGEAGLDLYWDKTNLQWQIEALEQQIDWAIAYQLPIILHTREAFSLTYQIVQQKSHPRLKGIFHCFNGTAQEAEKIFELQFWVGIGGTLTYPKNIILREAIKAIPLEAIVLETDAPYLAPVPYRGKRNESSYIEKVALEIAKLKNMEVEKVIEVTSLNAQKLFGVPLSFFAN
ncbi:MAG: TatD family hydrolase [Bacteroidia bacterium]|nr:TatD family hydrolase [Bacteroidia bacterium]MDW8158085.1 TatD family hydrolase [Bacteroidia bacterium]